MTPHPPEGWTYEPVTFAGWYWIYGQGDLHVAWLDSGSKLVHSVETVPHAHEIARLRRIEAAARDVDRGWGPGIRPKEYYDAALDALRRALEMKP